MYVNCCIEINQLIVQFSTMFMFVKLLTRRGPAIFKVMGDLHHKSAHSTA